MSPLAYRILAVFINHVQRCYQGEFGRGHLAAWTLSEMMGWETTAINGVDVKIHPLNKEQKALRELIDHGIVEEIPELPERFRLIVVVEVPVNG